MEIEKQFISIATVVGDSTRATMLWQMLDGRAYTAGELAISADVSPQSASNHLGKLSEANLVKINHQGRHRYYSLAHPEVAHAIESLANLVPQTEQRKERTETKSGFKYCRTCYDHLAGKVGVLITDAFISSEILISSEYDFILTENGKDWFLKLGISIGELISQKRRSFSRQCLDWSERKPHLAGLLGSEFLNRMMELDWFRRIQFSRELLITSEGKRKLYDLLKIEV